MVSLNFRNRISHRVQDHIVWRLEQWHQQALHRRLGHLGTGSKLDATCIVYSPDLLSVGNRTVINNYCVIFALGGVEIGDDVLISASCNISTVTHPADPAERHSMRTLEQRIIVEDGAWIGANAVILPGVRIGRNAVVGAGAVVTKDVQAGTTVVGVPARPLERRRAE